MHDDRIVALRIEAYTPASMPMAKLAAYMSDFAALLGAEERVHFEEVREGSTILRARIEFESVPVVQARLRGVRNGAPVEDAARAFSKIDDRLANDNAIARLTMGDGSENLLNFPGRTRPLPQSYGPFSQNGQLDGVLISIGGTTDNVNVHLQDEVRLHKTCQTTRSIARELRHHLFDPIRVFGKGRWIREEDGTWTMRSFRIETFELLETAKLADVVALLHSVPGGEWADFADVTAELSELRLGEEA